MNSCTVHSNALLNSETLPICVRGPEVARLAAEYGRMADSYTSSLQLVK